jgi:hypothetical protein
MEVFLISAILNKNGCWENKLPLAESSISAVLRSQDLNVPETNAQLYLAGISPILYTDDGTLKRVMRFELTTFTLAT